MALEHPARGGPSPLLPPPARAAGEEVEAHFRRLVECSADAVLSTTLDGVITTWNPAAEQLYGWSAAEAVGKPVALLLPPEFQEELSAVMARLRRGERMEPFETTRGRKDGSRVDVAVSVSPVRDDSGRLTGAAVIARDITERRRAEEAVREAERRKDAFLAILAHELRNPLGAIGNALEVVRGRGPERRAAVRDAWEIIDRQAGQLARLVDDLLDASRIAQGKLRLARQEVALAAAVAQAVEAGRPLIDARGQTLAVALPAEAVVLDADPARLAQVLGNLLANSARYTAEGGHIWLTADREGGEVIVRVRDDGMGIAAEVLPRLFDLFMQSKRALEDSPGGLGIGLSLVKSLVELHGGRVGASSPGVGRGSEFWVRLPVLPGGRGAAAGEAGRPGELPAYGPTCRALVVDDSRDAADSLALLLGLWGHGVRVAYDGPAALEAARAYRPEVIFLDLGLPGMTGYEVARQLRQEPGLERTVLVALTGYGQEEDRRRSEEAGFHHHLVKPADPDRVRQLLAEVAAPPGTA